MCVCVGVLIKYGTLVDKININQNDNPNQVMIYLRVFVIVGGKITIAFFFFC